MILRSSRLALRPWDAGDCQPFRDMCADARVMEFFPAPLTAGESDALAANLSAMLERRGWGVWVLDVAEMAGFAGMVGLRETSVLPSGPCVEVMWRLRSAAWGHGYASEAAALALDFGFRSLGLAQVMAFTALPNLRSQAVMKRLGMAADGEFDHPVLPEGHWLRRHVVYRKTAP